MNDEIAASFLRVTGYLELGLAEDAMEELDALPQEAQESRVVLHLRVDAMFRMGQWREAMEVCLPMLEQDPGDPAWWIQAAFATRRADSIAAAEAILQRGQKQHPEQLLIHYNLACYACVQGRVEEALALLSRLPAEEKKTFLEMALKDDDLAAIHPRIVAWQREHSAEARES
ncbi:tetratricopeptide repeat protein [Luteolibacter sp. GHJ8]|uniref:Tetratricopeptide repeat protein n=1 Tax=Luteolibacter rhizosphaerae TaxID=2989719 RepID=A0ABT3G607_9BACT|nr:tetratricopeptide repeat protein [Luteolibacter rhizosphaerae]MCW1915009.1 tetratricopeptide repeat protein [Luteolibacter rhizosphaerae]